MNTENNQSNTSNNQTSWLDDSRKEIENIWEDIYKSSSKVVETHTKFGFTAFVKNMNPKIEDIILSLRVIESMLDTLGNSANMQYSDSRIIFNCKQQILLLQEVAVALQNDDKDFYELSMGKLKNQSPI